MFVYIVTYYGYNSTHGDIYTPTTSLFTDFVKAYQEFDFASQRVTLAIRDKEDGATQYINPDYDPNSSTPDYIVIEDRRLCGKRGTAYVIARCSM
jgi:hypothetical protein